MPRVFALTLATLGLFVPSAHAYIDVTPTLGRLLKEASQVVVLRVEKINHDKNAVIFSKAADLKGMLPAREIKQQFQGSSPRTFQRVFEGAEPGTLAVAFFAGRVCQVCVGTAWYECHAHTDGWWLLSREKAELSLAYHGSVEKLRRHIETILAGKETVITTVAHGGDGQGSFFEVVFKKSLQGRPVQRVRASLAMPDMVYLIGTDPRFFVGLGPVGKEEVPTLVQALTQGDRQRRIEAAGDLALLGPAAKEAAPALARLLKDDDTLVRIHAAEALAKIVAGHRPAIAVLGDALKDREPRVRQAAARALARIGPGARTATTALVEGLKYADDPVRLTFIEALGAIGDEKAVPALIETLQTSTLRLTAAEALGNIGPAARKAVPALVEGLSDKDRNFRWSCAVSLARIGGPGTGAAVRVFVETFKGGDERAYYNATLCLAALGPEAKAALPALAAKQGDELAAMARWSIEPDKKFPWQMGYTQDRDCDRWFFAAHVRIMGPRAREAALSLADALIAGRAGTMPSWGYLLLQQEATSVVPALVKGLQSEEAKVRHRSADTLAGIGPGARDGLADLEAALQDKDGEVQKAARRAIAKINGK